MIGVKEASSLREVAAVIEQLGDIIEKNKSTDLNELSKQLRLSVEKFEPIDFPTDITKPQLIQVLYFQLQAWKKSLTKGYKTPIAKFAEEHQIALVKASTLKSKDDPISVIVANTFNEKIKIEYIEKAVNALQGKGYVVSFPEQQQKRRGKKGATSNDPIDILLNS